MSARIVSGPAGAPEAARILAGGGLVALPTETVYGLAACALNPKACAAIFEAKGRPLTDPLIVHLPNASWLPRLARATPLALRLAEDFWPGPLTLVLNKTELVPEIITSGQPTVAMRISAHVVLQSVLEALAAPVAAPSANRFGRISPTTAQHVVDELGDRIPLILDGGPCLHGIESTIVLVGEETLHILRQGPVTRNHLEVYAPTTEGVSPIASPGNMASHYAPTTPMRIVPAGVSPPPNTGLLAWSSAGDGFAAVEWMSRSGDLREAAANLYSAMRRLDSLGLDQIFAELPPAEGLGLAIIDRLRKASAHKHAPSTPILSQDSYSREYR